MKKWLSLTVMTCIVLGAALWATAKQDASVTSQAASLQKGLEQIEHSIAKYGASDELLAKRDEYLAAIAELNATVVKVEAPASAVAPVATGAATESEFVPDPVKDDAYMAALRSGNTDPAVVGYYRTLLDRLNAGLDLTPTEKETLLNAGLLEDQRDDGGFDPLDNTGGPDGFGYRWVDNLGGDTATFLWEDIVGAPGASELTAIRFNDDAATAVNLSFGFPFYGVNRTTIYPSTNGAIGMSSVTSFSNTCTMPTTSFSQGGILALWDDLDTRAGGLGGVYATDSGSVWVKDEGTRVIIQWDSIGRTSGGAQYAYSFQAILYATGKIKLQYVDLARTGTTLPSATIAIQQGSTAPNNNYLVYNCSTAGNAPQDTLLNRAVWFYTSPFSAHDFNTVSSVSPASPYRVEAGATFNVVGRFRNAGTTTESAPVKYQFNGGAIVSENTAALAQFATEDHDFTGTETAPATQGSYTLTFWTDLATDTDRSNDTVRVNVIVYEGRCCYNGGSSCLDTTAAGCTSLGGAFDTTLTCAEQACPVILQGSEACVDAPTLGVGVEISGTTVGYALDAVGTCVTALNTAPGVWYKVIGTGDSLTATTCFSTGFDTKLGIFCGSCDALTCVNGNDDATCTFSGLRSRVNWASVNGTEYYLLMTGFLTNSGAFGLVVNSLGAYSGVPVDCSPTGRCCYLNQFGAAACVDNRAAECTALGGTWNDLLSCATTPCEIGRCCYLDNGVGACADNTLLECNALGGTWNDALDCATTPCPVGRCCYLDNGFAACADNSALECTALNGTWNDALDCATTPCEIGRCCYDDNGTPACTDNTLLECNALSGTWTDALDCANNPCPVPLQGADACANAVALTVGATVTGTLAGNTPDANIPTCGSGYNTTSNGVWYTVTGTGNTMTASLCDPLTSYDSELFVFCGACDAFTCIDGDDDDCATPALASTVTWCSSAGTTYFVFVTAFGTSGNSGNYALLITDDGVACNNPINCTPFGRCCYIDNGAVTCVENLQTDCAALGGSWNATLTCATPCPQLGRCCYAGATLCETLCQDSVFLTDCNTLGGTWTEAENCNNACPATFCTCDCEGLPNNYSVHAVDATTYPITDLGTLSITINVPVSNPVTDLNLRLDAIHTFDADMLITLTSPLGTVDTLSDNRGTSGDNFLCTVFDDEAATAIGAGTAPFTGSFIPDRPLSLFDGENPLGNWTLTIYDQVGGDFGYVAGVCLELEAPPLPCDPVVDLRAYVVSVGTPPLADHIRLHFTAPQDEDYVVYSTTNPMNDGNPNAGTDPDFTLEATIPGVVAGPVVWDAPAGFFGLPLIGAPKIYVVVADCPAVP